MNVPVESDAAIEEESPTTRRSDVELTQYAREVEAILARGGDPEEVQAFRATLRPSAPPACAGEEGAGEQAAVRDSAGVHAEGSDVDQEWFRLDDETAPADGPDGSQEV